MKRERDPTPEEFEKLLDWLDSDRDVAAQKYETIRHRLIKIFVSRGCIDAETLADEVMNRVAVRIDKIVETYQGEPARCFQGFADNVYLEYLRDRRQLAELDPSGHLPDERDEDDDEQREYEDKCLTQCMGQLTAPDGELFRRYFREEKRAKIDGRKDLAVELGITVNALRIKAHRIRQRLRPCMEACLDNAR